jgi:hypothetical protein
VVGEQALAPAPVSFTRNGLLAEVLASLFSLFG